MSIADDLRKAYDERKQIRNAYEQGYAEGMRDAVKHGHWECIPNTPTWKCSICGYEITGFIDRDGLTPMDCKVNYCSRCGAKMDESTQSNDSNTLDALGRR